MEAVTGFIFLGSKITVDSDCSHKIKRHLLLESYDKPREHVKKPRRYFANKGTNRQSFFCIHLQIRELDQKKAEHQRIDAFELWCWRRLLRVPRIARRSN